MMTDKFYRPAYPIIHQNNIMDPNEEDTVELDY